MDVNIDTILALRCAASVSSAVCAYACTEHTVQSAVRNYHEAFPLRCGEAFITNERHVLNGKVFVKLGNTCQVPVSGQFYSNAVKAKFGLPSCCMYCAEEGVLETSKDEFQRKSYPVCSECRKTPAEHPFVYYGKRSQSARACAANAARRTRRRAPVVAQQAQAQGPATTVGAAAIAQISAWENSGLLIPPGPRPRPAAGAINFHAFRSTGNLFEPGIRMRNTGGLHPPGVQGLPRPLVRPPGVQGLPRNNGNASNNGNAASPLVRPPHYPRYTPSCKRRCDQPEGCVPLVKTLRGEELVGERIKVPALLESVDGWECGIVFKFDEAHVVDGDVLPYLVKFDDPAIRICGNDKIEILEEWWQSSDFDSVFHVLSRRRKPRNWADVMNAGLSQ